MVITYDQADSTVERLAKKIDIYWDGYDICVFTPAPSARHSTEGIFRKTQYGYVKRYSPDSLTGNWNIEL